jgi:hypothetical protein
MSIECDVHEPFQTRFRPLDRYHAPLQPLDLVVIETIPEFHWQEEGFEEIKYYHGAYGLVTYFGSRPWYPGNHKIPGWVSRNGDQVDVSTHHLSGDVISSWDFWLPANGLRRIPYNFLLMSVFAEYPWAMTENDGPSGINFIRKGVPQFDYLSEILDAPYERLVKAHEMAYAVLKAAES